MNVFAYEDDLSRVAAKVPFSEVNRCKEAPGARWDPALKLWHWPITALPRLVLLFPRLRVPPREELHTHLRGQAAARWHRACTSIRAGIPRAHEINKAKALTMELGEAIADRGVGSVNFGSELRPWKHQARGCERALRKNWYGLFHETGTGKTITAGMWLNCLVRPTDGLRVGFVVCPVTLIESAWIPDLARWFPRVHTVNLRRVPKGRRLRAVQHAVHLHGSVIALMNYESVRTDRDLQRAMSGAAIVFDESSKLKNGRAAITQKMTEIAPTFRAALLLSGTPAPNSPLEYRPQMKLLAAAGAEDVLPGTLAEFRRTWCFQQSFGFTFRQEKAEELHQRMLPIAEWVRKKECVDLPEKLPVPVPVQLSPATVEAYTQMEDLLEVNILTSYGKELRARAKNALSRMMKLRQITAGFLPQDPDEWLAAEGESLMIPIGDEKIRWLVDFVKSHEGERIIVWTQFRFETDRVMEKLRSEKIKALWIDGRVKDKDRAGIVSAFKNNEAQVLVMHPGVAKYGLSFPGVSLCVYMSCSHSLEEFDQSRDRIHGIGRGAVDKHSTYYYLLGSTGRGETIDHRIQECLDGKRDILQLVFELDKRHRERAAQ